MASSLWQTSFGPFGGGLAGIAALRASRLAARFGLLHTKVATHVPSNILLILVPLTPHFPMAVLVLLVRFSISQMDVPTRQSYVMAVVRPDERSAAAGITGVARTIGAAIPVCHSIEKKTDCRSRLSCERTGSRTQPA